jgi:hypothetical protein
VLTTQQQQRDKPLGSEPWFNPEAVTEQKVRGAWGGGSTWYARDGCAAALSTPALPCTTTTAPGTRTQREWLEQQSRTQGGAPAVAWPEHIYENFFVVVRAAC